MTSKTIFIVYAADWDYRKDLAAFSSKQKAEDWIKKQPSTDEDGLRWYLYIDSLEYFE